MSKHPFAKHFAAMCRFEDAGTARAAQRALLNRSDADVRDALVNNKGINPHVVTDLLGTKLPAKTTNALLTRVSSREQLESFLSREKRDSVLANAVALCDDDLALLACEAGGKRTVAAIVCARHLDDRTRLHAANVSQLEMIAVAKLAGDIDPDRFDDDVVWEKLLGAFTPTRSQLLRTTLQRLLWKRPGLIDRIDATSPRELLSAAAGSIAVNENNAARLIPVVVDVANDGFPWPLMAAIANPRFNPDLFTTFIGTIEPEARHGADYQLHYRRNRPQVTVPFDQAPEELLPWLTKRAFSSTDSPARPVELLSLANHPAFIERRAEIVAELRGARCQHPVFAPDIDRTLAQLGVPATTGGHPCDGTCDNGQGPFDDGDNDLVAPMSDAEIDKQMAVPLRHCSYYYEVGAFCRRSETVLGADQQRWDMFWVLLDDVDGATTIGELVELAARL